MIADPAMLIWLDGATSKKEKPNENFAREFLELFTLGAGHYTERDVREAARAFTGWVRQDSRGRFPEPAVARDPAQVDDGPKSFLGREGRWGPSDIVRITLERPEAATFLARKLYRWFVSEAGTPEPRAHRALVRGGAAERRSPSGRSWRSFSARNTSTPARRIASGSSRPVEFSAGLVRMLEVPRPSLNPLALSAACDAQGQELFAPPNVEGWVGGPVWINSSTLLERTNWAADVIWGRSENGLAPFDPLAWAARYKLPPDRIAGAFLDLLLQGDLGDEARRLALDAGRDGTVRRTPQGDSTACQLPRVPTGLIAHREIADRKDEVGTRPPGLATNSRAAITSIKWSAVSTSILSLVRGVIGAMSITG